jgi:sterol desaturase/sphingolipid hydroxylase (fatty acid hydroxylase superfamily)
MKYIIKLIVISIVFLFLFLEFIAYMWHRFINHLGFLGDKIRVTHYCHHEEMYPHDNMISDKYKTSHDTWPWFIPLFIFGYLPLYLIYKKYNINKYLISMFILQLTLHVYIISYIHDSYHIKNHWLNKYKWYRTNKKYHYIHHLDNKNYGITTYIFDYLFGTFSDEIVDKKDIFNNLKTTCDSRIKFFDILG